jgi:hypothetical protein
VQLLKKPDLAGEIRTDVSASVYWINVIKVWRPILLLISLRLDTLSLIPPRTLPHGKSIPLLRMTVSPRRELYVSRAIVSA